MLIVRITFIAEQEVKQETKKVFVDASQNRFGSGNYYVGNKVIVVDGSYMMNEHGKHSCGAEFNRANQYELLTITDINKPFPTHNDDLPEVLQPINGCEITGGDGAKYYCSRINIKKFIQ